MLSLFLLLILLLPPGGAALSVSLPARSEVRVMGTVAVTVPVKVQVTVMVMVMVEVTVKETVVVAPAWTDHLSVATRCSCC